MENLNRKNIIIASDYFLDILGIKTIINTIGFKYNLSEVCTFSNLKIALKEQKPQNTFIIVTASFVSEKNNIDDIIELCKNCNVMYICNKIPDNDKITYFMMSNCNTKDACNKFTAFFNYNENSTTHNPHTSTTNKPILSEREVEVLKEVASGLSNKEIAEKLFISINTVISHRKKITEKLDIKSISGLTVYALMNELINPDEINI